MHFTGGLKQRQYEDNFTERIKDSKGQRPLATGLGDGASPQSQSAVESPETQPPFCFRLAQAATMFCVLAAAAFISYSSSDGAMMIAFFA
jgi:hypothetical protein